MTTEYRALRRAGLMCAREYRTRIRECDRILRICRTEESVKRWLDIRDDWCRRLFVERRLLAALRGPNGGVHRWRLTVIELRPRGSVGLLIDVGAS